MSMRSECGGMVIEVLVVEVWVLDIGIGGVASICLYSIPRRTV